MQRYFALGLLAVLVIVAPVWSFSRHWGYAPSIVIGFLLAVNLLVMLVEFVGRRRDWL
jgi:hypothetical protein